MPLIGNPYVVGDTTGNFKKLDNLSSYTLTFDPSVKVSLTNDTITEIDHRFVTGQRVTYTHGGGSAIGGLTSGTAYYIVNNSADTIKLATSYADALASNTINLTSAGSGTSHTLNLAFDGINTKFRATYGNGGKARITNASQLTISINGVLQQPFETSTPTDGYGIEHPSVIVFSVAPQSSDVFWGNIIANNFPTYDISDNKVDTFTANGVDTDFTLSQVAPNNESVLVTIDGVTQYPSDNDTARSYSIYGSVLSFTEAPANGAVIQARHIGFVGATSSAVTGFNGRTGNVGLRTGDPLVGVGIQSGGLVVGTGVTILNFVGTGNTFAIVGDRVDISIQGGGGNAIVAKQSFTITSSQSVFTLTENYDAGMVDVYVNGIRLPSGDFTETLPNIVTLGTAAEAGDIVEFISYSQRVENTVLESTLTNLRVTGISSVGTGITMYASTGIVSATSYYGDGSNLTNLKAGVGTNISGADGFTYVNQSGKTVTSNIVFDTTNSGTSDSFILLKENKMTINTGVGVTIGDGKLLIINPFDLPNPLT
jgi:hypothetical protein